MAPRPTAYFRGEGGGIWPMDLPLPPEMADQAARGRLVRVNADGSDFTEPAAPGDPAGAPTGPPAQSAPKSAWVGYGVRHPDEARRLTLDDAEAMTKNDLIDLYGRDADPAPAE